MGLVEDDDSGLGEDAGVRGVGGLLLDGEVGEEEVVVDDDDVGFEGLAAHGGDEAGLEVGAGLAEAGLGAGVELGPEDGGLGEGVDLGAVAGLSGFLPCGDVVILLDLFETGEDGGVAEGVELLLAEVVLAALHVADLERAKEGFEEGDVLEVELFLQVFGAGGDDDSLLALAGVFECREEVGEGFACAGSGFDDEVALVGDGFFNGEGHLQLAGAVFEGEGGLGEGAAGGEEGAEGRESGWLSLRRDGSGGGHGGASLMIATLANAIGTQRE